MDAYDLVYDLIYNIVRYVIYPIGIICAGLEFHRYIFTRYILVDEDEDEDYESHEPSIEMCSRCKNPDCSHRIADYVEG